MGWPVRRQIIATGIAVALLGLGIGVRLLQLMPYPKGEYNWLESPDERHRAWLYRLTDKGFFGGTRELYRIKVEMGLPGGGGFLTLHEEDIPEQEVTRPVDLAELEAVITWARDSYRVTYILGRREIVVVVPF